MPSDQHTSTWEHHQAELWDRIFQVTQDVVDLAGNLSNEGGNETVKQEMIKSSMSIGIELVRANAADAKKDFDHHLHEARLRAIETDYWLRLAYVLQQQENVQRDLSSIITQYSAIVDLLQKFIRHTSNEKSAVTKHHTAGPRIE